jgi:phospholipid/cholesterol/gamma-HCH transport system ATP-binding protein
MVSPAESGPIIEIEELSKSFGASIVLDRVSLSIPAGQTTAIIGASGTGKSVLLKHIIGLLRPDRGRVRVFGQDVAAASEKQLYALRRRMGMLFQDGALFDSMSVGDNVEFPLIHNRKDLDERARSLRVAEVLEQVELPGFQERAVSELSGGQRKRVGLARAIVTQPEVVLFDEPNSGLDPMTSEAIDQLIVQMKQALGITFVVISHDIVGTVHVADHIGMLYGGKLVAYGPTAEIVASDEEIVKRFLRRNLALPGDGRPFGLPTLESLR